MVKVLAKNSLGHIVIDNYFAKLKDAQVLGALYAPVDARSTGPKLKYNSHNRITLEKIDFIHLLKVATDLPSPVLSNNLLTMTIASDVIIDGVSAETNDLLEMSKPLAISLGVSPGTWRFDSKRSLTLLNPPKFSMTDPSNIGLRWRYMTDTNGDLVGLAPIAATGTSVVNNSTAIRNMTRLLDSNFYSYVDASDASNQSSTLKFTEIKNVRRIALRCTSYKTNYESRIPNAQFGLQDQNASPIGSLFINADTGAKQSNGQMVWARGSAVEYYTEVMDRSFSAITMNDGGSARSYVSMEMLISAPCQINIKGEIPTAGSTLTIPEYVANALRPVVPAGDYLVLLNDNSGPWKLRKL